MLIKVVSEKVTLTTDKEISAQWKNTPLDNDVGKIVRSLSGPETPGQIQKIYQVIGWATHLEGEGANSTFENFNTCA